MEQLYVPSAGDYPMTSILSRFDPVMAAVKGMVVPVRALYYCITMTCAALYCITFIACFVWLLVLLLPVL